MPKNTTGWCANSTTPASSAMCTAATLTGTGRWSAASCPACSASALGKWRRRASAHAVAFTSTASAAFQPKVVSMKALSQPQVAATISTGGAAYEVSVPPMDTLTNSTPSARYLSRSGTPARKICGASMRAAMVMAAGSVMSEPSSGTAASPSQAVASGVGTGASLARVWTMATTVRSTGRDAAMTMTTKTNKGSV